MSLPHKSHSERLEPIHLSLRDSEFFMQALQNPPKSSKSLLNAVKKYNKGVISK